MKAQEGGGICPCVALALAWVAAGAVCQPFPHPIDNVAVSRRSLWVASGNCLYELEPDLRETLSRTCDAVHNPVNKLLLPFGDGDERLLTCWTLPQGVCYERSLRPGANTTEKEFGRALVSCLPRASAVGKMHRSGGHWYLVVATTHELKDSLDNCIPAESDARTAISVVKDNGLVTEDDERLKVGKDTFLTFMDAFLWKQKGRFFFPYYHYYNQSKMPLMVVLEAKDIHITPHGQTILRCATSGTRILSSSWIEMSEERVFWVGIFSSAEAGRSPTSSALCIFNLTQVMDDAKGCFSEDFSYQIKKPCRHATWSINKSPSLSHSDLVSVYATIVLKKIVLFLGTGNGQLLKVILDDNMKPNCPDILYEIEEETAIFHKLALDPVDKDYIYLASNKMVRRIQVANCNKYVSCNDCLSAMDPHCGWCYLNKSCTLQGECPYSNDSRNWANISYGTDKCLKIYVSLLNRGEEQQLKKGLKHGGKTKADEGITVFAEISVTASGNFSGLSKGESRCMVMNAKTNKRLCENETSDNMNCSCHVKKADLTDKVEVLLISGSQNLSDVFELNYCSFYKTCSKCDHAGCTWYARDNRCDFSTGTCKQKIDCSVVTSASYENATTQRTKPMNISSIQPLQISVLGKSEVIVRGENLTATNILMVITGTSSCKPDEIPSSEVNGTHMKFCLPPSRKEAKSVCIKADGFKCSPPMTLHYVSLPKCYVISPHISWISGGRNITISGSNLNFTDIVVVSDGQGINLSNFTCHGESTKCSFTTPAIKSEKGTKTANIILEIEKRQILCEKLQYDPDPTFIRYDLITDMEPDLELKIHKKNDNLNISGSEIKVFLSHMGDNNWRNITFIVRNITKATNHSIIHCRAKWENNSTSKFDKSSVKVYIKVGNLVHEVPNESVNYTYLCILLLIPFVIAIAFFVTQRKSKQLNRKLNEHLELLECELRKEIREGFVELQMEKLDVVDSFGTIPFLDYRHFVIRAFFPEYGGFSSIIIEDTSELLNNPGHKDKSVTALYALICNKNFLVTLIHTLEKQKTFSVKDRCLFASYLTIALQTNLVYLTHILEVLTKDLMEQSSNIQPKLMLRRTESVVEKLLTNWMSICLAGFLRETVGEPFYLLITTLNQRIIKGPVDVITCKALYTLNEDWLLWQVPEFNTVALNVVFEKIPENEGEDTTQNIQVNVLDCDTIGQAKEKILQAFGNKNGSLYGLQLSEMGLALQSAAQEKELLDIDSSSVILEDGITRLNTIGHYEISDGATIKVFKKTTDLSDGEYSDNYCHLILPDSEGAKDTQGARRKGKQKFKVKEMYLTKLLSTKVAVHSVVEKLFRSIWTLPNNKAPVAIKYFFDFLDAQAENKKITDPDVVHIWKTNSLPLRFWVNILKNPQFVFDIKKTSHIDGCLSVIAQAFMDAFSLSEQLLGKDAPTNKLLFMKDIPLYKEEVKAFYKAIRDAPSLSTSELEEFLTQESKKHENEFNEAVALTKIYQYIARYFDEILNKLEKERGLEDAHKLLRNPLYAFVFHIPRKKIIDALQIKSTYQEDYMDSHLRS